jgi:hypothetical protein
VTVQLQVREKRESEVDSRIRCPIPGIGPVRDSEGGRGIEIQPTEHGSGRQLLWIVLCVLVSINSSLRLTLDSLAQLSRKRTTSPRK